VSGQEVSEVLFDLGDGVSATGFLEQGGHLDAVEAAGDDVIEDGQVVVDVDSHAVIADAPGDADADRGNFSRADPETWEAWFSLGGDTVVLEQFDADGLEFVDVVSWAKGVFSQVEYGVTKQLAWVVGGGAAAASDVDKVDVVGLELVVGVEEFVGGSAGAASDDGVVFKEEDGVGDSAS